MRANLLSASILAIPLLLASGGDGLVGVCLNPSCTAFVPVGP